MKQRVAVSDHALVRYLERVGGFAIEELRQQIEDRVAEAAALGASAVTIDGCVYRIAHDAENRPVVATVLPVELYRRMQPRGPRKRRKGEDE